jgi:hypothetical protein
MATQPSAVLERATRILRGRVGEPFFRRNVFGAEGRRSGGLMVVDGCLDPELGYATESLNYRLSQITPERLAFWEKERVEEYRRNGYQ